MSPDEVKTSLGNPDKVVDLGYKQIFVYKDMKIVFMDGKISDVQYFGLLLNNSFVAGAVGMW